MKPVKTDVRMDSIREFLARPRFAMIGVSRKPRHYSRRLFSEFMQRGFEVVPVNPALEEVDGRHCWERVANVEPPVQAAMILVPRTETQRIVSECVAAGIQAIWIVPAANGKPVETEILDLCRASGMDVIHDQCPRMFMQNPGWFHQFHGFVVKLSGAYPS
jgi:uncharacterized protein